MQLLSSFKFLLTDFYIPLQPFKDKKVAFHLKARLELEAPGKEVKMGSDMDFKRETKHTRLKPIRGRLF